MNLTIPIMKGQFAHISIQDRKDSKVYNYLADHSAVRVLETTGTTAKFVMIYNSVSEKENVTITGVGRNKRLCRTHIDLNKTWDK